MKENNDGQLLLEAAGRLPLVLVSTPGTTPECVWRGIEVGAAEVLEKPLSQLKLQNIWQHVVRKVCHSPKCPCALEFVRSDNPPALARKSKVRLLPDFQVMDGREILTSRNGLLSVGEVSPCQVAICCSAYTLYTDAQDFKFPL